MWCFGGGQMQLDWSGLTERLKALFFFFHCGHTKGHNPSSQHKAWFHPTFSFPFAAFADPWLSQGPVWPEVQVVARWMGAGEARDSSSAADTSERCWLWHTCRHFATAGLDTDKATLRSHALCRANSSPTQGREHPERKPGDKHCEEKKQKTKSKQIKPQQKWVWMWINRNHWLFLTSLHWQSTLRAETFAIHGPSQRDHLKCCTLILC